MADPLSSFEQLRDKAAQMELAEVNFLGPDGKFAKKRRAVVTVEFIFIDGTKMVLSRSETERPEFDTLRFDLRPSRSN